MAELAAKTQAILKAYAGEELPGFTALKVKDTPEAPKREAARLASFGGAAPSQHCEPHAGMAEAPAPTINPVTVTPICDTGPLVKENIMLGFQMAIDLMQAQAAIQAGDYQVPVQSQFTGARLP